MNNIVLNYVEKKSETIVEVISGEEFELFEVANYGPAKDVGIYLKKSLSLGNADFPADQEPYIDIVDILKYGKRGEGLYFLDDSNTKIFFSRAAGSSPKTKISLGRFESGEKQILRIGFDRINDLSSRRFFIDIIAE
tara:strand:+ start:2317 stop:2727 length:411 start_codon:yes stop_codon:yes gene_type:complete